MRADALGHCRDDFRRRVIFHKEAPDFSANEISASRLLHEHVDHVVTVESTGAAEKSFRANDVNLVTTLMQNTSLFIYAARLIDRLGRRTVELETTLTELQATKDKLSQAERRSKPDYNSDQRESHSLPDYHP